MSKLVSNFLTYLNRVRQPISISRRLYCDFKSIHNVANLYPSSNPSACLRKPLDPESLVSKNKFNGYIPVGMYTYV